MEIPKTVTWFACGLVGLLLGMIPFGYSNNLIVYQPLSTASRQTSASTLIIPRPIPANNQTCPSSTQEVTLGYIPNVPIKTNSGEEQLKLFGTLYAADYISPLPNARVEIWRLNPNSDEPPFSPYLWEQTVTDSAGHYEFNLLKSTQFVPSYIHYRVSYQGKCLLLMHLSLAWHDSVYHRDINGPLLHGPIDIILSVRPSTP